MVAPAAACPLVVETAEDLQPLLRDAENLSSTEARELLKRLPMPQKCSQSFRQVFRSLKSLTYFVPCILGELDVELLGEDDGLLSLWAVLRVSQYSAAIKMNDGERAARLADELQDFFREYPRFVMLKAAFMRHVLPEHGKPLTEHELVEELSRCPNRDDALAALAVSHLYESYGVGVDVDKAMECVLRGVAANVCDFQDNEEIRSSLCLSLARIAHLKGEAFLPLQIAALRLAQEEAGSKAAASASLLLYHAYKESKGSAAAELAMAELKRGFQLKNPLCAYWAAQQEHVSQESKEQLLQLAQEWGLKPGTDYRYPDDSRTMSLNLRISAAEVWDFQERSIVYLLMRLLQKARVTDVNVADEELAPEMKQVIDGVQAVLEKSFALIFRQQQQPSDHTVCDRVAWENLLNNSESWLEYAPQVLMDIYYPEPPTGEGRARVQKMRMNAAARGGAYAWFKLAEQQLRVFGELTPESWENLNLAYRADSPEAAWLLSEIFSGADYGGPAPDPEFAATCYREALALLSGDAWRKQLLAAQDETAELYALIHMRHGRRGSAVQPELDSALCSYAASHPETVSFVTALRLLYMRSIEINDLPIEHVRVQSEELLGLVASLQPPVLSGERLHELKELFKQRETEWRDRQRRAAVAPALTELLENSADVVLVKHGSLIHVPNGQGVDSLSPDLLRGAHVVCRECDRKMADVAIRTGARSVTSLRMSSELRDYLRSHEVAANGWEVEPSEMQ